MEKLDSSVQNVQAESNAQPEYVAPTVQVMNEAEILSAFQVTAAGTTTWWAM